MTTNRIFLLILFTLLFSLFNNLSFAQRTKDIERFQQELLKYEADKKEKGSKITKMMDTTKANIYSKLVWGYYLDNPDSAFYYAELLKEVSDRIGYKKGMAKYYTGLGLINMNKHLNIPLALENYNKAVKIYTEISDKDGLGWTYNDMGLLYLSVDNYAEAIKAHTLALKVREEIGDKVNMSESYRKRARNYETAGNYPEALKDILSSLKVAEEAGFKEGIETSYKRIGEIYEKEGNYPEALKNFIASSKVRGKAGSKFSIATSFENLGRVYLHQGQYEEAEKNFRDGLAIFEEINNPFGVQQCNSDIATIYFDKGNYDDALKYYLIALKIAVEMKNNSHIADLLNKITVFYVTQNKYQDALQYATKALSVGIESKYMDGLKVAYGNLADIYGKLNDFSSAYKYHVLYQHLKDSLVNSENTNKMKQLEMHYAFDKDAAIQKAEQDKKDAIQAKEIEDQKFKRNISFAGMGVIILFSITVIILRSRIAKERRLKALEMERTRISKDLHDDLGSELSKISLLSDIVNLNTTAEDMKPHLENISRSSKAMVENMGDIIWIMNAKNDLLPNLVSYTRKYAMEFFETTSISCHIIQPNSISAIQIEGDFRRNIFLVVKEALNNILKHSGADKVEIVFAITPHSFSITIHDNGKGIDQSKLSEFGNGLVNMEKRMKDIGGKFSIKNMKGTVIEISIPV